MFEGTASVDRPWKTLYLSWSTGAGALYAAALLNITSRLRGRTGALNRSLRQGRLVPESSDTGHQPPRLWPKPSFHAHFLIGQRYVRKHRPVCTPGQETGEGAASANHNSTTVPESASPLDRSGGGGEGAALRRARGGGVARHRGRCGRRRDRPWRKRRDRPSRSVVSPCCASRPGMDPWFQANRPITVATVAPSFSRSGPSTP